MLPHLICYLMFLMCYAEWNVYSKLSSCAGQAADVGCCLQVRVTSHLPVAASVLGRALFRARERMRMRLHLSLSVDTKILSSMPDVICV
jgi:hypothetical protein